MPNAEKFAAVAELTEQFNSSAAAVITEYRGLTVKQVTDLRRALGTETTYAVVKNTLTKRAAADAGVAIADTLLTGPTAIAFIGGDPVEAAKGLRDFARTNPLLVIKGGLLDGKSLSPAEVAQIADLESREVLLAKMAGALKALPSRAVGLFQAPLSQMARLAKALEEKKPVVAEAAADTPAAAPAADPVSADGGRQAAPSVTDAVGSSTADTVDTGSVTSSEPAAAVPELPAAPAAEVPAAAVPEVAAAAVPDVPAAPVSEAPAEPAE